MKTHELFESGILTEWTRLRALKAKHRGKEFELEQKIKKEKAAGYKQSIAKILGRQPRKGDVIAYTPKQGAPPQLYIVQKVQLNPYGVQNPYVSVFPANPLRKLRISADINELRRVTPYDATKLTAARLAKSKIVKKPKIFYQLIFHFTQEERVTKEYKLFTLETQEQVVDRVKQLLREIRRQRVALKRQGKIEVGEFGEDFDVDDEYDFATVPSRVAQDLRKKDPVIDYSVYDIDITIRTVAST